MVRKERGREASKWLMDITRDQNLENIGESSNTSLGGLRRWFAGRIIQPIMHMLWYDPATGEAVQGPPSPSLGDARMIVTETTVNTDSQATFTLTVPAGYAYRLRNIIARNATRAGTWALLYTPNGGTATNLGQSSVAGAAATYNVLYGSSYSGMGSGDQSTNMGGLWLQAGDTVDTTNSNFQALDTMRHYYVFESFNVGTVTT